MPVRIHRALGCYAISAALASLAWCVDPIDTAGKAGWDGWRGDLHVFYEGHRGGEAFTGSALTSAAAGWGVWQWHLYRLEARVGLQGQVIESDPYHETNNNSRFARAGLWFTDMSLRYPLGAPGGGSDIQFGVFRAHPGEGPDLFGNYVTRSEPYPGRMPLPDRAADTLGSAAELSEGLRIASGAVGGPLRAEALLLEEKGDFSCFGFLEGTLPRGLRWSLSAGVRHAFDWHHNDEFYSEPFWAKGGSGVVPIDSARSAEANGSAFSDSGGITQRALVLSARLEWLQAFGKPGMGGAFGEVALLGWENQPLLYQDRWRRLAATLGLRPPTWGLLQLCLLQLEWRPGAYHPIGFTYGSSGSGGYLEPADAASPWSYAVLLGRDIGRHWAVRSRFSYAPQVWTDVRDPWDEGYERVAERVAPDIHRGKEQLSLQLRVEYRFGRLMMPVANTDIR